MHLPDLNNKRIAIWGVGREGLAAARLIRAHHPNLSLVFFDEAAGGILSDEFGTGTTLVRSQEAITAAVRNVDVVVKSPGVSIYHPILQDALTRGVVITSLLNLWFDVPKHAVTVCVTGTKGKSTTASIIASALRATGATVELAGNIGVPLSHTVQPTTEFMIIEVSSYQAADFVGDCDVAVLTSLFPEHLDWHQTLEQYYRDKLNLLRHSKLCIINSQAADVVAKYRAGSSFDITYFNTSAGFHFEKNVIWNGATQIAVVSNTHLARHHNLSNVCAALTVVACLGLDVGRAVDSLSTFVGLPHRQQELGLHDEVLFVDDSISTTPESTVAALDAYKERPTTVLLGGYDRGLSLGVLLDRLQDDHVVAVVCMGDSGARIASALAGAGAKCQVLQVTSMQEAVAAAQRVTPKEGVVLLSPAAPSYGQYKSFIDRGRDFALKSGFAGIG